MTVNLQTSPYLPRQKSFPVDDVQSLSFIIDKVYIETASRVNERTIGLYANNIKVITGEKWYLQGEPNVQQSLRQVYQFTATGTIPHNIPLTDLSQILPTSYGSFTDGTNWYGAIYASNVAIAGQVSFYVTPTNIVVIAGAGAPAITSGTIVLTWLSVL